MKKLTKKQAQLLARRLKYRAPCYYDLWFDCITSSASIRNEGNQVVVEISAYDTDTKNVLQWARDNVPLLQGFVPARPHVWVLYDLRYNPA